MAMVVALMVAATVDKATVPMVMGRRAILERVTKAMTPATATLAVVTETVVTAAATTVVIPELALALLAQVARMEPVVAMVEMRPVLVVAAAM
jgi:hypothetical protein